MRTATTVLRNIQSGRITPIIPWKRKAQNWDLEAAEKLKKIIGVTVLKSPGTSESMDGCREFECTGWLGDHITASGFFSKDNKSRDVRFSLHINLLTDDADDVLDLFEGIPVALKNKITKEVFWDSLKVDKDGVVPYISIPLGAEPLGTYDLLIGKDAVDAVSGLLKKVNLIES